VADTSNRRIQPPSAIRGAVEGQTVEPDQRSSHCVSHLVGHTDSDKQPSPNSLLRLWQQARALRQAQLEELVRADPSQLVVLP
jgi:hypothetical protein